MDYAEIRLVSGDVFTVEGSVEEVERQLSDAARSGHTRLAWFTEQAADERVGINPDHVTVLRSSEAAN